MGLPDRFIEHGSTPQLLHLCHIDQDAIVNTLSELISETPKPQK
jgi:deoxyxylulose-5-phosphate synthase